MQDSVFRLLLECKEVTRLALTAGKKNTDAPVAFWSGTWMLKASYAEKNASVETDARPD